MSLPVRAATERDKILDASCWLTGRTRYSHGLTTLIHHLALLRDAGLVSVSGGRSKVYRLRREGLADLERGLEAWLE